MIDHTILNLKVELAKLRGLPWAYRQHHRRTSQDMTDHDAFLHAIRANWKDDSPRLIYADWLEEQGNSHLADFIRQQIEHHPKSEFTLCTSTIHSSVVREREGWVEGIPYPMIFGIDPMPHDLACQAVGFRDWALVGENGRVTYSRGFAVEAHVDLQEFLDIEERCRYCIDASPDPETNAIECNQCDGTFVGNVIEGDAAKILEAMPLLQRITTNKRPASNVLMQINVDMGRWFWSFIEAFEQEIPVNAMATGWLPAQLEAYFVWKNFSRHEDALQYFECDVLLRYARERLDHKRQQAAQP